MKIVVFKPNRAIRGLLRIIFGVKREYGSY